MFKKGFTLQELLITLAIIGVVAAITAPTIQKLVPNEQKLKYMKAYNAVTSITNDIVSDSSLYWDEYNNEDKATCNGLGCLNITQESYNRLKNNPEVQAMLNRLNITFNNWYGANGEMCTAKFAILFASKLNLTSNPACNISPGFSGDVASCTFTTTDGYKWTINTNLSSDDGATNAKHTRTVDVDNNGSSTTTQTGFQNSTPKKIDTYQFNISNTGNSSIPASEYLANEFLQNPTDMHNTSKEMQAAKNSYEEKAKESTSNNTGKAGY